MYGSMPWTSLNSRCPKSVHSIRCSPGTSSTMPAAVAQWSIEATMFLPTPNRAMASSPVNTVRLSPPTSVALTASNVFFSHPYLSGNVSCPENCGR